MTGSIQPPEGVVGSDDWTAIDSRTGKKLTDEEALILTDAEVDWLKNDGTQRTYDSENEEYIEFKNKNKDGSGGVDPSYDTRVYDPDHPEADEDGFRNDKTTTGTNGNGSSGDPQVKTIIPNGVLTDPNAPENGTQGWDIYVGDKKIDPKDIGNYRPEELTFKSQADGNTKIEWDEKKNVWVKTEGGNTYYYDPRVGPPNGPSEEGYTGKANGWNDKAYYEKYQAGTATPTGIYIDPNAPEKGTQAWDIYVGDKKIDPKDIGNYRPEELTFKSQVDGNTKIEWDADKKVWVKTENGNTYYYDQKTDKWGETPPKQE